MEKVIVVFADLEVCKEDQEEFLELVHAIPFEIIHRFDQNLKEINFRTYIGKGKCEEIEATLHDEPMDYIIFDHDLSALQIRNLEAIFLCPVMDRTEVILTIFEKRASTPISKLQVEQARLEKLLPRLIGANTQLGRQSGSGKNKGAGEKQLELDRRRVKARMGEVKRELKKVEQQRETQRKSRLKSNLPLLSLVGYTNAGKSTIMNQFLTINDAKDDKKVIEQDMLFATLDTSIRHVLLSNKEECLLSDTVGFVNHLPHTLIKAFASTLEEVTFASILLQVVDVSNPEHEKHMRITQETLQNIGAAHIPMITIFNKCDKTDVDAPKRVGNQLYMSARRKEDFLLLEQMIHDLLYPKQLKIELILPYKDSGKLADLLRNATLLERIDEEDGMHLSIFMGETMMRQYQQYIEKKHS